MEVCARALLCKSFIMDKSEEFTDVMNFSCEEIHYKIYNITKFYEKTSSSLGVLHLHRKQFVNTM